LLIFLTAIEGELHTVGRVGYATISAPRGSIPGPLRRRG
jgi:hypothetical protein